MRRFLLVAALLLTACTNGWHGRSCYDNGTCDSNMVCLISKRPAGEWGDYVVRICVEPTAEVWLRANESKKIVP